MTIVKLDPARNPRWIALSANQTGWIKGWGRRHNHLYLKQFFLDLKDYHDDPEGFRRELLDKDTNSMGWVLDIQVEPDAYIVTGSSKTVRFVRHRHSKASIGIYKMVRLGE
jgi:hypothetical protein